MDETLGHFYQVGTLWYFLNAMSNETLTKEDFFMMMNHFSAVIRPKIIETLSYIAQVKYQENKNKSNDRIMVVLYTNSESPKKWPTLIKDYLEMRVGEKVFDKVIATHKCNGKIVEPLRTSHMKSYSDVIRILNITDQTKILFLDDQEHPLMKHAAVDIFPLEPYIKLYRSSYLLDTMSKSPLMKKILQTSVIQDKRSFVIVLGSRLQNHASQMRHIYQYFYNKMNETKGRTTGKIHQKVKLFLTQ
jgi:hypothetical protein